MSIYSFYPVREIIKVRVSAKEYATVVVELEFYLKFSLPNIGTMWFIETMD